jgi:VanZ family protein
MHTLIFIAYAAIVAVTSLRPGDGVSIDPMDKVVHLLVYFVFALLGYRALANKTYYLHMCLGIVAWGALMEIGQSWIPGRQMSAYDFLANTLGVALGAAVVTRQRQGPGQAGGAKGQSLRK